MRDRVKKKMFVSLRNIGALTLAVATGVVSSASAGQTAAGKPQAPVNAGAQAPSEPVPVPADYLIGAQDMLSIVFWRDKDMSADVTVRPDGKISLPLLQDIQAAGYTIDQLRAKIQTAAGKYVEDPNVTIVVREIHSRNVFVTGMVNKPGVFPLTGEMRVLQLIALAGGLQEYAKAENILIVRTENGHQNYYKFNYKDVLKQKHIEQNIPLKPGDTVLVP